jgi:hypothetical protein
MFFVMHPIGFCILISQKIYFVNCQAFVDFLGTNLERNREILVLPFMRNFLFMTLPNSTFVGLATLFLRPVRTNSLEICFKKSEESSVFELFENGIDEFVCFMESFDRETSIINDSFQSD